MSNDLLDLSEEELLKHKAQICIDLYKKGKEQYGLWTEGCAKYWYESLRFFVEEFIQPEFPIPDFHNDWYYWSVRYQSYMNLSPRDHAKTTVHSVIRTVWEICVNRNITFLINLATLEVAKIVLGQIKSQLTQNPRIRMGFGVFNPMEFPASERTVDPDWSQTSITVNRNDYSVKDPTVAVIGSLTNVLSRRADRLIQDDILNDQIAFSDAESERLERWRINDVVPVLKSNGQEIITGTPYRKGDFYHGIQDMALEKGGEYHVFVGDAIVDTEEQLVLWPERWSYDSLMKQRRKIGTVRFNRNYRCRITSDEDSPFPMVWFTGGLDEKTGIMHPGCFDDDLVLGNIPQENVPGNRRGMRFCTIGVDPAIGSSKDAKYFCAVVLGVDYDNYILVADIIRGQFTFPMQKRIVIALYKKYNPQYVVVEANAYQKALIQGLEEEPDAAFMPVVQWFTTGSKKSKPDIAVPAMDVYFETGRFRIPRGDIQSREKTDMLVEELHYWGIAETSDMAMALWFAFERLKSQVENSNELNQDVLFGDRQRYEQQKVMGLAGHPIPRKALEMIRNKEFGPLQHLSPLSHRERLENL